MKKVVSADMVAHLWANQLQSDARVPGYSNFYFEGASIYSYGRHFCIAKHVTNDNGEHGVLYTDRGYSNTTSKHKRIVLDAASHLNIIHVPDADNFRSTNFEQWEREIKNIATNLRTARKPAKYTDQIESVYQKAVKYATFFNIEIPVGLINLYNSVFTPEYKKKLQEQENGRLLEAKIRKEKADLQAAINLELWRAGKMQRYTYDGFSYLKLSATGDTVQTSQGIFIPLHIAKDFYSTVLETVKNGGCTNCNMRFMHQYNVREITEKQIIVGCHTITIDEIQRLTASLGWN